MLTRIAIAVALLCCTLCAQQSNVLLVVADDLGVDSVGCYGVGATPPPTPNIDALAARGVLFRNAWSNAVCSPTRACMMTGRYSLRTLVGHVYHPSFVAGELLASETTLPEVLAGSGHGLAFIGKWHLGTIAHGALAPNVAGWPHFAGLLGGQTPDYFAWPRTVNGTTATCTTYATTQIVDDALTWIAQQAAPWVCIVAFNAPHEPLHAPPSHLHTQNLAGKTPATDPFAFFAAMVEALDVELGRLLAAIDPQSTTVIFTGDNGTDGRVTRPPFAAAHAKATPYQGGIHVPLIVAGPSVVAAPREVDAIVGAVDLFATIADLAGVDARAAVPEWVSLDAVSAAPYLADPAQQPLRTYVLAEQFTGATFSAVATNGFATVRDARYKLVRFYGPGGHDEVYDLLADPLELVDLASQCANLAGACGRLRGELTRLRTPPAGLFPFGTPCQGATTAPVFGWTGTPSIGASYAVTLTGGVPLGAAALVTGASWQQWGTVPLPLSLALVGGAGGCWLSVSPDITLPIGLDGSGGVSFTVPVPASLDLVGRAVFHQWLVADVSLTSSGAAAAAIGF